MASHIPKIVVLSGLSAASAVDSEKLGIVQGTYERLAPLLEVMAFICHSGV